MNSVNILSMSFDYDLTRFSCCTTTGVQVFQLEPLVAREKINTGGALSCKVDTNRHFLFAIVHSSKYSKFSEKTVMVFNYVFKTFENRIQCESVVISVRTGHNKIIIVTMDNIFVYTFPVFLTPIKKLLGLNTRPNPMGLCEVTPLKTATQKIIAYPGYTFGSIDIADISGTTRSINGDVDSIYNAHSGEISGLAINQLGTLIASVSSMEMFIKIWDTCRKIKVAEVRRSDIATVYCMNFSPNSEFLCCSNVKGTIEIFAVIKIDLNYNSNPLPVDTYVLSGRWKIPISFAILRVPAKVGCICTFLTLNTVAAISLDGVYYKFEFSENGTSSIKETRTLWFK